LVQQCRKYVAPAGRDDDLDFLVFNPHPRPDTDDRPFVLGASSLASIERALVVIKAWHTETFTPALLTNTPELLRFLEKKAFQQAVRDFGQEGHLLKILVLPSLPQDAHSRDQSIAILRAKSIDAVISFRTMLTDLVAKVEPNRNYQKSDLLQTFRILKNYDFLKEPQLEFFKSRRKPRKAAKR
ncbi:MAG: hypothetical protein ACREIC_24380, partial [Limisphaerales bacterium]